MLTTSILLAIAACLALCGWFVAAYKLQPSTKQLIVLVIIIGALLRIIYAIETPSYYAPDEQPHFKYIQYLAVKQQLPVQTSITGEASNDWEYYQPPLYYLAMTPVYLISEWMFDSPQAIVSSIRLTSTLFWLANMLLLLGIIRNLNITDEFTQLSIITIAALLPTYTFISAMINNDSLLAALATGMLYWLTRYQASYSWAIIAGLIIGLAMCTKLSAIIIIVAFAAFILIKLWNDRGNWQRYLQQVMIAGLVATIIWAPVAIRNVITYGSISALDVANIPYMWPSLTEAISKSMYNMISTFWATSGIYNDIRGPLNNIGFILLLVCVVGGIYQLKRRAPLPSVHPVVIAALLAAAVNLLLTIRFGISYRQAQGRFLIPSIFAISLLLSYGWRALPLTRYNIHICFLFIAYSTAFAAYSLNKFDALTG